MSNKNTKTAYYSPKWISRRLDDVIDSTVESIGCFWWLIRLRILPEVVFLPNPY